MTCAISRLVYTAWGDLSQRFCNGWINGASPLVYFVFHFVAGKGILGLSPRTVPLLIAWCEPTFKEAWILIAGKMYRGSVTFKQKWRDFHATPESSQHHVMIKNIEKSVRRRKEIALYCIMIFTQSGSDKKSHSGHIELTKINRYLPARIFPRLLWATCGCSEFWLAHYTSHVSCD